MSLLDETKNELAEIWPDESIVVVLAETLHRDLDQFLQERVEVVLELIERVAFGEDLRRDLDLIQEKTDEYFREVLPCLTAETTIRSL